MVGLPKDDKKSKKENLNCKNLIQKPKSFEEFFQKDMMMTERIIEVNIMNTITNEEEGFFDQKDLINEVVTIGADGQITLTEKYEDYVKLCKVPKVHEIPKNVFEMQYYCFCAS